MITARDFFVGNWRNKGIALFFAVTIWLAAYRSEKQVHPHVFQLDVRASQPDHVLTSVRKHSDQSDTFVEFDGRLRLVFSGPRKQVARLRDDPPLLPPLEIPPGQETHQFTPADFGFPRDGVDIIQFQPESLRIDQDDLVTIRVEQLAEKLTVTGLHEGVEVATREVNPPLVQISGPKTIVGSVGIGLSVAVDPGRDVFRGRAEIVPILPQSEAPERVRRAINMEPSEVEVRVTLRAAQDVLPVDAIRLTFRVPPLKSAFRISIDDVVGETVPVEFVGRKDEIARLRDRLREQPGLALSVRVPAFDRETGGQFTFTEDSLELFGFPGVQIRQHESRRRERKAGWSYSILPVKDAEK